MIKKLYYKNSNKLLAELGFKNGMRDGFSIWYERDSGKKLAVELWVEGECKRKWNEIKET